MNSLIKVFGAFIILLFPAVSVHAEHLIGGSISYQCLGNGSVPGTKNYRIRLTLTRDCSQFTPFDNNIDLGLFQQNGSGYSFYRKIQVALTSETSIPLDQKSCSFLLYSVCVKEALYQIDVTDVPVIARNYMFSYQRCCRNMTISNITDPGRTGSTLVMELTAEAQNICNQSAFSDIIPPLVVCANQPLDLNLNSADQDGDVLVYEFCAPLTGGGPEGLGGNAGNPNGCNGIKPDPAQCIPTLREVTYANNTYNALNPFPSETPIQLTNGRLIAKPNAVGQFIFGICIKEFRNGILLSIQRREMQINIAVCNAPVQALVNADRITNKTAFINLCDPTQAFTLLNQSRDTQYIKSVFWQFSTPTQMNWTDTTFNFVRVFGDTGLYQGKLFLNKGNQCSDSLDIRIQVNPKLLADFNLAFDSCTLSPVRFLNTTIGSGPVSFGWQFGDSTVSTLKDPEHLYPGAGTYRVTLKATHVNQCTSEMVKTINLFPAPPDFKLSPADSIFCFPQIINLGIAGISDPLYQYRWELSDGQNFTGPSPMLNLNKPGNFNLKVSLVSPNGCRSEKNFTNKIISLEKPTAAFDLLSNSLTLRMPDLQVKNNSSPVKTYLWDFGDGGSSILANPSYTYQTQGSFVVQLIVIHENGCSDTARNLVTVGVANDFFIPNTFTPNGDGNNDIFLPVGIEGQLGQYTLTVIDRWGSMVFQSTEQSQGWDGTWYRTTNKIAQDGVYIYMIRFITEEGNEKIVKGSVTLIR